jgi:hypothetical protein
MGAILIIILKIPEEKQSKKYKENLSFLHKELTIFLDLKIYPILVRLSL